MSLEKSIFIINSIDSGIFSFLIFFDLLTYKPDLKSLTFPSKINNIIIYIRVLIG